MEWIEEADGVFRGGGVKGLGLAGALLGFAEHPEKPVKQWVNVAGASAGAILACYLACGHDAADMADLMKKTKFGDFQDFPPPGKIFGGGRNLIRRHGLARGEAFRLWFGDQLEHKTFAATKTADGKGYRLKLIAVDVTNKALLVLPDDLPRYRRVGEAGPIDPDQFEIADAARMSMSIPYFFEPFQLVRDRVFVEDPGDCDLAENTATDRIDVEHENAAAVARGVREATVRELTERELTQQRAVIIDGGTLSNFPVWLFDVDTSDQRRLVRPTFGFTLTGGKGVGGGVNKVVSRMPWALRFGVDIFHTSQEAWDARFVSHSTRVRTVVVNAGDVGTTDFNLPVASQDMLIQNGRDAAKRFLDRFDLSDYQNTYHRTFADSGSTVPADPQLVGAPS